MSGWQPIETAPRDGTVVLGYEIDKLVYDDDPNGYYVFEMRWREGTWSTPNLDEGGSFAMNPAGWMPLPAQPK